MFSLGLILNKPKEKEQHFGPEKILVQEQIFVWKIFQVHIKSQKRYIRTTLGLEFIDLYEA